MSKYIEFVEVPNPDKKTKVFMVRSKMGSACLGYIRWYNEWRQYTFYPGEGTVWDIECLVDIRFFIGDLMAAITNAEREHQSNGIIR